MRLERANRLRAGLLALPVLLAATGIAAGENRGDMPQPGDLSLQLNTLETVERGCRLTFVMHNGLGQAIEALGVELALFAPDGGVSAIIALDAGALPAKKTQVQRFVAPDVACADIARVLLNDLTRCDGEGLSPAFCIARLRVSSRVDQEFLM